MELEIVKFFQSFSSRILDVIMWFITKCGEEIFFLLVFAGLYILYDKKFAIKFSFIYLVSVGINSIIKIIIKRPRPYLASNEIINRLPASSYSFPSGHSQGYFIQAYTFMIELNNKSRKKNIKITMLVFLSLLGVFVMLSRLYWGQHYLSDVLVGGTLGIALSFVIDGVLKSLPKSFKDKFTLNRIFVVLFIVSTVLFIIMIILQYTVGFSSRKIYTFLGVFTALGCGGFIDIKYIKFASNYTGKVKLLQGFIMYTLIVGLYILIDTIFIINGWGYYIVYLFLGVICSIILPLTYKKLFKGKEI